MPVIRGEFEVSDELVNDLRSRFLEEVNSDPKEAAKYHPDDLERVKYNDWYIARYILHQDHNVENALKMMKKSLQFRNELEVNTIKKENLKEEFFESRLLQIYNHGKENYPILAIRAKVHKKIIDEVRLKQQYMLYWMEKAVRMNNWNALVVLFDCSDVGYKNVDLDFIKFMLNALQHHYPWSCHRFMIYDLPWYLTAIWQLVKAWIPEKHQSRIVFVDKESILEYVDQDQLPICLGGTCTDQYESKEVEEPSNGWF